jgi:acyl-CoA dehydrogenase
MSEMRTILLDTAARAFSEQFSDADRRAAASGTWPDRGWSVLEELGLPLAFVSEEAGGFGLDPHEALGLVRLAARHAIPLPLVETMFANHLFALAGMPVGAGPLSIAPVVASDRIAIARRGNRWFLDGTVRAVPWARHVETFAAVCSDGERSFIAKAPRRLWSTIREDITIGGLPADTLRLEGELADDDVAPLPAHVPGDVILLGGAALRAVGIAGTMQEVLELTARYVTERSQFGRPLAKFQAIQQDVAKIAGQAVAASSAGDMAVQGFTRGFGAVQIAAAKARASEAAGIAAGLAHQLHGAIGITEEYRLHYLTKQLWAWRDEFGSEVFWQEKLGRLALDAGGEGLWRFITAV